MKRSLIVLSCFLLLMVLVAGCGGQSENVGKQPEAAKPDVRIIKHAMGETKVEGTPQRIVTLYQGATDAAVALGIIPVGVVESWTQQPMYEYLRDQLKDAAIVGLETQPNLEEIAKLKPDLIIASKLRNEKVYQQLSEIAPTVTHETVYKFKDTVELIGQAANKEEKANELLEQWNQRTADFKTKISAKLGAEWPVEASVLNFRSDHARIYVTGFAGDILSELGFVRSEVQQKAADEGNVVLKLTDKESIPSMNADVFFVFNADGHSPDAAMIQKTYDEWTNHPLWKNLDAVKNGQVTIVDEVPWNMGGGYIAANTMLDQIYDYYKLEK
ncbi:ABC transporter substrate-binding protein [Paenibacillus sabinae]|uniref:ABC-type Fe3+-hydroxamate transport system, periplasmic component n=1 Tax=Paenibacillus sabinae T27 TaxID=1268072 RepID=X4ZEA4_9BACL|nr:iron-siderophore ABC transporter substrate-binding protein [Paenibacillus sabinae]AHV95135.1 ABC-type Fe3+-hydroxamate transport system, periplasmic component [Paenibacillus sabinae T27]